MALAGDLSSAESRDVVALVSRKPWDHEDKLQKTQEKNHELETVAENCKYLDQTRAGKNRSKTDQLLGSSCFGGKLLFPGQRVSTARCAAQKGVHHHSDGAPESMCHSP